MLTREFRCSRCPLQAIKTREGIVRSKGNVLLLKVVKKTLGRATEVHSTGGQDPSSQPELIRIGWRYDPGMRQLGLEGEKDDPWHPSNGMFATIDVKKCAMEALGSKDVNGRDAPGVEWFSPVFYSAQKPNSENDEAVSEADLLKVSPPDKESLGLEMRRAILVHRFMQAYKQTVSVKENKPVGHARKGEPAVTSTAALTAFENEYMVEVSSSMMGARVATFLDKAKLTAKV